ncbi:fumarate hydratase [Congzhengia minquanensis]|uniref:Fumarate hydratase n=1 Tax=Congzhengia minquanensis TaxID=2763657 RepID=A0A926DJ56_9FIRM|nr:fumarate hydratase [Congzhengia minquanensis]MBC8539890.1 fumarate hydratase [Congzhengia minquanensis]
MRTIHTKEITETVKNLCIEANIYLGNDIKNAICTAREQEQSETAKVILEKLEENMRVAEAEKIPVCQDTGMAVVFLDIGQDVHVDGGLLKDAVNEGVAQGYTEGFLRKSVVTDPIERKNSGDNTPAVIHYDIVPGDKLKITVAPKGFGSENMGALKLLKPADGLAGVKDFVLETVKNAGANPCPPIVVGVGIGGTMEMSTLLAKRALLVELDKPNENPFYASLEQELLEKINALEIGVQGFGGTNTALGVKILTYPTHIAGLPCAVNINCHVTRHKSIVL